MPGPVPLFLNGFDVEPIILASKSLNRRNLLTQVKIPFKVLPPKVDEERIIGGDIVGRVEALAKAKVKSVLPYISDDSYRWVVGFDTLIEVEGQVLGKPANRTEAKSTLEILAGKAHRVITGVALLPRRNAKIILDSCTSLVYFNPMGEEEIEYYLNTEEWQGAAGGYRIQETGAFYINSIEGSYSNVVGLPLSNLYGMLRNAGYSFA